MASLCASASSRPVTPANSCSCSRHVSSSYSTSNCGHTPSDLRSSARSCTTCMPPTQASPLVGSSEPVSCEMVVVLPAPLWPTRPKICPAATLTLSPSTARSTLTVLEQPLGAVSSTRNSFTKSLITMPPSPAPPASASPAPSPSFFFAKRSTSGRSVSASNSMASARYRKTSRTSMPKAQPTCSLPLPENAMPARVSSPSDARKRMWQKGIVKKRKVRLIQPSATSLSIMRNSTT
mmetsp:Transcript_3984/g.14819  ORF Transcript_3984/g.14819 Transcript_3984/m.14819 type:complete len:236 (+) Transcript_3984:3323-4030(+)